MAFSVADARRVVGQAIDKGVDLIDVMSHDEVERVVGDVVRQLRARDRVVVATKVQPAGGARPPAGAKLHAVLPAGYVQHEVERSLRATKLDVLPVVLLQRWQDDWLDQSAWPELRGAMQRMVHDGKVMHWGVALAGDETADAVRTFAEPVIGVIGVPYSVFDRRAEAAVLAAAREHDVGVIVRRPLDDGALGGELAADAEFTADDTRGVSFAGGRLAEAALRLARLTEYVTETPAAARSTEPGREAVEKSEAARRTAVVEVRTIAELALRFALSNPAVTVVVPGMRNAPHLDANLAVADGRALSPALLERLAEHAWKRDWDA